MLFDWLLSRPPSLREVPATRLQSRVPRALASWVWRTLTGQDSATWSADLQGPFALTASLTGAW